MTESLPTASGGSLSDGIWLVFPYGARTIRAWGSSVTGMERIYVDETKVSEQRSARRISRHAFEVDGKPHSITFKTKGALRMELQCTLAKRDIPVTTYAATFDHKTATSARRTLISILAGVLLGTAYAYLGFPGWVCVALFVVVVVVQGSTRKRSAGIKIEEIDSQFPVPSSVTGPAPGGPE